MRIRLMINNQQVDVEVDAEDRLVDVIRGKLGLTGTKIRCRKGLCGMCTVLMDGKTVKSCMIPAIKAQGSVIITIEGIGSIHDPHPLQKAFVDKGAIQCGYCTPAFIVAAYGLLQRNPNPSRQEIVRAINPILCRCTGYQQIIEAIEATARGDYD
ncbi:MAG: (2Fe-2S)-binding protein [Candidatus Ranarchaeia archaeon]